MAEATSQLSILVRVRDEASAALSRLSNDVSDLGGSMRFSGAQAGILAGALAAIAGAAIIGGLRAFAESQAEMARFDAILRTLPPNLQLLREHILAIADEALIKFGFSNEAAAISMARLLQATGNADLSFKAFQAAMDLARFKGIGLEEATQALILSFQGGGRILKQFGIEVDEHASKETILEAVLRKVQGQAESYSKTLQGQIGILREVGNEAFEALGARYAPAIEAVTGRVIKWIEQQGGINALLEKHKVLANTVAVLLAGAVVAGLVAATAAVWTLAGAFIVLGLQMGALVAVAGLVALLVGRHFEQLVTFLQNIFLGFGRILTGIVDSVLAAVERVVGSIRSSLQGVLDFFNTVRETVSRPIQAARENIGGFFQNLGESIKHVFGFQHGGIVTRPTLGLVGEAGPEAIIPLSRLGGGGLGTVNVYLQGDFFTDTETAERFGNAIARLIKNQLNLAIRA